ncbi:MAG: SufD family Fe-S cluster assembly protein [Lachnospiraceae bacterium]|nr:SufD family Fe-S cluster assembly protein [Lachnospiraceae bacterium]
MEENKMIINRLPVTTWNRLKVNHKVVTLAQTAKEGQAGVTACGAFTLCPVDDAFSAIETGMGPDFDRFVSENAPKDMSMYMVAAGSKGNRITITIDYDMMPVLADASYLNVYRFYAQADSELTIFMDIRGTRPVCGLTDVKIVAQAGARITLVQAKRLSDSVRYFGNVGTSLDAEANFDLVHIGFSGSEVCEGAATALTGEKSSARYDIGYVSSSDADIDQNYLIRFTGKKTTGNIFSNGVLSGTSRKSFRATIDFVRGCGGAAGSEKEDVLLMDDTVVNQTTPLILCSEEDVEGVHGATLGRLAEDILFYLEARGVSKEDAYQMVANGRMASVIRHIPQSTLRSELLSLVSEEEADVEA